MARTATAVIKLTAIKKNYLYAKSLAAPAKAIATVKANAYGHGAIEVAKALTDVADAFGVACIEEAKELRDADIQAPILLLEGFFTADELTYISENNLWCVIHSQWQLEALQQARLTQPINVWLKMDSGMHRLGFLPDEYAKAWHQLTEMSQVNNIVHMSHFSSADDINSSFTAQQTVLFIETINNLPGDISIANSPAVLTKALTKTLTEKLTQELTSREQWVRPGIILYGACPIDDEVLAQPLIPAMTFTAKVISQRVINKNDSVGYNALWTAEKTTKIGTVSIGYADGYPRHAPNGTPVYINGKQSRVLGRVSMDMMMVDLSMFTQEDCIGFEVELWGDNILASKIAKCCETISYTLFCGLTRRVSRRYIT
ncbi:alanine racemase [Colwellia ponticola]|uniref:Alanine racemase n=1 Tax=Colwellia ponticola TaxID=2304625 RepID=A0A8H2JP43_9GAMM|nr:alanine racemase [Colwellia ponticola]TMM46977.1 alanine racemase [Colwellia ponticola]